MTPALLLLALACRDKDPVEESPTADDTDTVAIDADADGYPEGLDCDDADANINPGATEVPGDGFDNDCDPSTPDDDLDGDGYGADDDCDDGDDGVNPGAEERCNGVDDDCNGLVDDGVGDTWYTDADGDGWGDDATGAPTCSPDATQVGRGGDCDDADDRAHPGGTEVCDGADNDCDGVVDVGAADAVTWYQDADGDGQGTDASTVVACERPSGFVRNTRDCDDGDATAYEGATEVCDGVDNDCDGTADEADADGASPWYLDADSDGYGDTASATQACDAPTSRHVAVGGDCDDSDASVYPGASPACDGSDADCDGLVDNDADADGYADASCGGDDCNDGDANVVPQSDGSCAEGATCKVILDAGNSVGDGVYTIDPDGVNAGLAPWDAWCDMTTAGGGWTRLGHTVVAGLTTAERDAIRLGTWQDYTVDGYGAPTASSRLSWVPLRAWNALTAAYPSNVLRIVDSRFEIRVNNLSIGAGSANYPINWGAVVNGYQDIVGGAIRGQAFTTWDSDHDTWSANCASDNVGYNGGWWYTNCYQLSMLHADGNLYSWRSNVDYSVTSMHIWLREN